jgi:hypothetical protein
MEWQNANEIVVGGIMPNILDLKDISKRLNVHPGSIYRWIARGECTLPLRKMQGKIVAYEDEFANWLANLPHHPKVIRDGKQPAS